MEPEGDTHSINHRRQWLVLPFKPRPAPCPCRDARHLDPTPLDLLSPISQHVQLHSSFGRDVDTSHYHDRFLILAFDDELAMGHRLPSIQINHHIESDFESEQTLVCWRKLGALPPLLEYRHLAWFASDTPKCFLVSSDG